MYLRNSFNYIAFLLPLLLVMMAPVIKLRAQNGASNNFRVVLHEVNATGVSPSQSVSGSAFSLKEGMIEKGNCSPQQSMLYRFLPGMIFPENEVLTYCETDLYIYGCQLGDGIKSFVFNEIENINSGCSQGGYGNFSILTAIVQPSVNYNLQITGGYSMQFISVWIDLNDNFSFEENERMITNYSIPNAFVQYSIPLTLPAGSNEGLHRMRARVRYNSPCMDPCVTYSYGEAEDYSVYVLNGPAFGTISGSITNSMTGTPVSGATITDESGLYSTTSGPDGHYQLANLPAGNHSLNVNKTGFQQYSSDVVLVLPQSSVTLNMTLIPILEYCTAGLYSTGCTYGDNINNFILGSISNIGSGCSPGGYGNFTAMSTDLVSGNTYPVQIASQYGQQHICLWIDWNDNYYFDENERILSDAVVANSFQNYTFNLTIPLSAAAGVHRMRIRSAWATNPADPCLSYNYGETEDYTVTLSGGGVQTGTIAGTITDLNTGLTVSGAAVTDATGVYSTVSGAGGGYELSGLPAGSYVLNVSKAGYSDFTTTAISVVAAQTTIYNMALTPVGSYCISNLYTTGCQYGDYIDNFNLGNIHNTGTGCSTNGYGDFTSLSSGLIIGNTYAVQITNHVGQQYLCIWIDLNNNFTFDTDERLLSNASMPGSNQTFTFDLQIPESANPGQHRLRVRTAWNINPSDACATYTYGETEDYTVVLSAGAQTGTIAGVVTSSATGLPVQGATVADVSDTYSTTTGVDGHYQLSDLPPGIYTLNVSKSGYSTFTSAEIVVSAGETTTLNVSLTQESAYCTTNLYSVGCSYGDYLDDFVFADIQNLNSGCSANSYGDFTTQSANVDVGNTYTLQASSGYNLQRLSVWIDMNDDQVFDVSEKVLSDLNLVNAGTTYSAEIMIPVGAVPGIHRLRVRTNYGSSCSSPCNTYIYGEVEDYTIVISVPQPITQEIMIHEGWSGISTYLVPEVPAMQTIFQEIVNEIIIVQNGTGVYWPSQQINTIGNWNNNVGYKVKATEDVVLNITGMHLNPAGISLNTGWNIMPLISECIVNTEELLAGETGNLVVLKEVAGTGVYWPGFGINTLPVLLPGKSYYMNVTNEITLNFMNCDDNASITEMAEPKERQSPWGEISFTPVTHQIGIPAHLSNSAGINSVIGAFTSENLCAGFTIITGENIVLTLFGDDPLTNEKDGFEENEPIWFKLLRAGESTNRVLSAEFAPDFSQHDGLFHNNGLSVVSDIEIGTLSSGDHDYPNPVIFPNPADEILQIYSPVPVKWVSVSDVMGRIIKTFEINHEKTFDLNISFLQEGIYTLTLMGSNKFFVQKFIRKCQ